MSISDRIQSDIDGSTVMLYMKGTPAAPMCGFSKTVVDILQHLKVNFSSANVLEDMELRQGIKEFSEWPTIPQLYVQGEFLGGCDIAIEMFQNGELQELLQGAGAVDA